MWILLGDELPRAAADLRPAPVTADPAHEPLAETAVVLVGHQDQLLVQRDAATAELLARLLVGRQARAQLLGGDAGDLDLDGVRARRRPGQELERQDRLLPVPLADRVRAVAQALRAQALTSNSRDRS